MIYLELGPGITAPESAVETRVGGRNNDPFIISDNRFQTLPYNFPLEKTRHVFLIVHGDTSQVSPPTKYVPRNG